MVMARMAGFNPGTSPPPVRIPITPFFLLIFATEVFLSGENPHNEITLTLNLHKKNQGLLL
jgi:hypothetical protein